MKIKNQNLLLIIVIVLFVFGATVGNGFSQSATISQNPRHLVKELKELIRGKKAEGCDVLKAIDLNKRSKEAFKFGDRDKGLRLLKEALAAVRELTPGNKTKIAVSNDTAIQLEISKATIEIDFKSEQERITPHVWELFRGFTEEQWNMLRNDINLDVVHVMLMPKPEVYKFPIRKNRDADPADPDEYDFSGIDEIIQFAIDLGIEVDMTFFGIPATISADGSHMSKPENYEQYGKMIKHIMMHFMKGWPNGKGHYWGDTIKTVRLWREPDIKSYWHGTPKEFYELYEVWVKNVKDVAPDITVGCGGFARVFQKDNFRKETRLDGYPEPGRFIVDFLNYCQNKGLPLDLLVWDGYGPLPYCFYLKGQVMSKLVKKYPKLSPKYGTPQLMNDQWNMYPCQLMSRRGKHESLDSAQAAAHNISAIIYMLDSGTSRTHREGGFALKKKGNVDFTLAYIDNRPKPVYYAYKAIANMRETSQRIKSTGSDKFGFAVLAAKSENGNQVNILISNFNPLQYFKAYPEEKDDIGVGTYKKMVAEFNDNKESVLFNQYNLNIKGLPWQGKRVIYERYLVDDKHKFKLVESGEIAGTDTLSFTKTTKAPEVQLIKLKAK